MTLSFEPYDDDGAGAPRVFVGMWRPPYETLSRDELRSLLPAGAITVRMGEERDRWLAGGLDRPLYRVGADPLRAAAENAIRVLHSARRADMTKAPVTATEIFDAIAQLEKALG